MATDLDEIEPGFSRRLWAAYVLGRFPHALLAWHEAFFTDPREVKATPKAKSLYLPPDEFPSLYLDLDDAVRELGMATELDPHAHIEIRNSLYRSEEASSELLNAITELPASESITEVVAISQRPVGWLIELSKAVELKSPDTRVWRQLGDFIGEWMWTVTSHDEVEIRTWNGVDSFLGDVNDESINARLRPAIEHWRSLVQACTGSISLRELLTSEKEVSNRIAELDASFLSVQQGEVVGGPLLILDLTEKQFTLVGHEFRFDQFQGHAQAGLKCFLVLAEHPQIWVPRPEITKEAGVDVEPEHLPADMSSFRRVVAPATKEYASQLGGQRRFVAERAFVVAQKLKRHSTGAAGAYKLAIDPERIARRQ